jgi:TraG P-loop domain
MRAEAPLLTPDDLEDAPAFAGLLPHGLVLDPATGVVLLSTPRFLRPTLDVGCAWSVPVPRNIELLAESACLDLARIHQGLFRNLPKRAAVQTIMHVLPTLCVPGWEALRQGHEAHWAVQAQQAAIRTGLPHAQLEPPMQHRLRQVHTTVTVRLPVRQAHPRTAALAQAALALQTEGMTRLATALAEAYEATTQQLAGLAAGIQETLRSAGHRAVRLDARGLGQAIAQMLNPFVEKAPVITQDVPLSRQVGGEYLRKIPLGWRLEDDRPERERLHAQVLTLSQPIPQTYPGMLCAPRAPEKSEPLALWNLWEGPFSVVVNVTRPDQRVERMRLNWKRVMAFVHRFNLFGASSPENQRLNEELETFMQDFFATGGQMLRMRVHLVLWGTPAQFAQRLAPLLDRARLFNMEFIQEPHLGSTLFLSTLPLGYDPTYPSEHGLKRSLRTPITHVAQLATLYGGLRGTATPTLLLTSQRGEAVGLDLFDIKPNPHMLITGMSGGGKSFWINYLANQVLPMGASMVILDHLPSYKELCAAWGGRYIVMDFNAPVSFNPFYGPLDEEHQVFLLACLTRMASGSLTHLSQDHVSVLAAAIAHFAQAWDATRGEPLISHFRSEALLAPERFTSDPDEHKLAADIARWLRIYCGHGVYAGFFDRPNQLILDPVLTVIETAGLEHAPDLKSNLVFVLLHLETQHFKDPARYAVQKFSVVDESLFMLEEEMSAAVLERIELTFRKLNTSAIFLAQYASQLSSRAGQAILKGSPTMLFLQQMAQERAYISDLMKFTPVEEELFSRAQLHDGWSAGFLRLGAQSGGLVGLVPDLVTHFLADQDHRKRQQREALLAAHGGDWQAVLAQVTHQAASAA